MNLRHLRTIVALSERGTFSAAGEAIGRSHSAVSLHIKALETELGVDLVDRGRRPPVLTDRGMALVGHARRLMEITDEIAGLSAEESLIGALTVGVVPSAMSSILPPALADLSGAHPRLRIAVRSGSSVELAAGVRNGDIDVAVTTEPDRPLEGLRARIVAREPLVVIAPAPKGPESGGSESAAKDDAALLTGQPFIWFNRKTWAGQQIERHLLERGLLVRDGLEVDSLEAITALVRHGLGVSVVPLRAAAPPLPDDLTAVPFGDPRHERVLVLLERSTNPKARLADALCGALERLAGTDLPGSSPSQIPRPVLV